MTIITTRVGHHVAPRTRGVCLDWSQRHCLRGCQLWRGENSFCLVFTSNGRQPQLEMWIMWAMMMLTQSRPVMMTHLWWDSQARPDTHQITRCPCDHYWPLPWCLITPSKHSQLMSGVTQGWESHEKCTRNMKCEMEDRAWNVPWFENYHNVKSETNQPICNSYKRIFYGRRFHPYIQNTWYLNHLICISKKHCRYILNNSTEFRRLYFTYALLSLPSIPRSLT